MKFPFSTGDGEDMDVEVTGHGCYQAVKITLEFLQGNMGWAMFWQLIFAKASEDGLEFRTLPHVSHESFYDYSPLPEFR